MVGKGTRRGKDASAAIGIIGGSGLYTMPGLAEARELHVKTPFGDPSDVLLVGSLEGQRVAAMTERDELVLAEELAALPALG